MRRKTSIILGIVLLVTGSFVLLRPKGLKPIDYVQWVDEASNGLKTTQNFGSVEFTAQYRPLDYQVVKHQKDPKLSHKTWKTQLKKMKGRQYFSFRLAMTQGGEDVLKLGIQNQGEYAQRVNHLAFNAQRDFQLIDGGDTLPCKLHHFERSFGLAPHRDLILVFEDKGGNAKKEKVLLYQDQIFGTGTSRYTIEPEALKDIPSLITY